MQFDLEPELSEELSLVADSAASFCDKEAPPARVRDLRDTGNSFDRALWRKMADLGWTGMLVPEAAGGLGMNHHAMAAVARELGRVVAPEPILECAGLSATLLRALPQSETVLELQQGLSAGTTIVIAAVEDLVLRGPESIPVAEINDTEILIEGECRCVPVADQADALLVPVSLDGTLSLCLVTGDPAGLEVRPEALADGSRHATLRFSRTPLTTAALLADGEALVGAIDAAFDTTQVLMSSYLLGLMERALELSLEYLRTREQFGRPIGSFQSLQHRAVDLFIQRSLAESVVAAALHRLEETDEPDARRVCASRAKYRASVAALEITRSAIQMHGAIGFTDECDVGLFVHRALVIAARYGNADWHLRRIAAYVSNASIATAGGDDDARVPVAEPKDKNWNAMKDDDFRSMVRAYFESEYPEALRDPPRRLRWAEIKDWYLKLSAKGWVAPNWPVEHGGMGLSPGKHLVFIEEQERWGIARAPDMGIQMVGPLLIQHGTPEQQAYYLPKILAGEHVWCQGYSEPNAGSDLASLKTEAVLDGDEFVVNGQKSWTTLAHDATHIFMLVRTDKTVKKQAGISFLLADIKTPGITIRPIRNLAGHDEFCETFFDDVRVPAADLVGGLNRGWSIAKALLGFERIFLGSPKQSQYALQRLETMARGADLFADAAFCERYTRLAVDVLDLIDTYARFADVVRRGETLGPDVSLLKIWATETFARLSELMVACAGGYGGQLGAVHFGAAEVDVLSQFYNARPATIYGGSNEIQRNILAKHVLRLPD